ncbi:MAG: MerR family transcriptional regulator [Acidimicrobiaceae bacterium]|nr:MerR family transcriptional regulator [Acidimicrobiaceae bacterium]
MSDPTEQPVEGGSASVGSRPVYSIGAVAKMVGVDASTLRAWEDRYRMVVPTRSGGGQRLYSRDDLERLHFVVEAMREGSGPGDAHRLLAEKLGAADSLSRPAPDSPKVAILLAERDRYAAQISEYFLRTEGYDVYVALDPEETRRWFAERNPDLSVVELMMSGGGLRLCRDLAGSGAAPVLAVSALNLAEEALAAGASAFLSKPLNPLQLISTVRDLLGQSALTKPSPLSVS